MMSLACVSIFGIEPHAGPQIAEVVSKKPGARLLLRRSRKEKTMKRLILVLCVALLNVAGYSSAQQQVERKTTVTKLLENERVSIVRMMSKAGDKGAMQKRPDRVLHIIQGAKVRFHYPDGKTEDAVWKPGDVVYQKADNRQVENIDTRDLEYLSVHLK